MVKGIKISVLILLGLVIYGPIILSQSNFYIKPTINYKMAESFFYGFNFGQRVNSVQSTDYFDARLKKFAPTNSINIGIGIGYKIGDKNKLELNWSQDVTGSSMGFYYYTYYEGVDVITGVPYKSYSASSLPFTSFMFNNRFELKYYQQFSNNLSVSFGLGMHYTNVNIEGSQFITDSRSINNIGDSIKFSWQVLNARKITPFISIGLDYKINAGNTYLFNLSSYYVLGFQYIESTSHTATITNSTDSYNYNYLTGSRGGGIYFEISREMDVSKIILKSKNLKDKIFKKNKNTTSLL